MHRAVLVILIATGLAPPGAAQDDPSERWDLMRVAQREAERLRARLGSEVQSVLTRMEATRSMEGAVEKGMRELEAGGPDVVPILLEAIPQLADHSPMQAAYAARAVVRVYGAAQGQRDDGILRNLQGLLEDEGASVQKAVLWGLRHLDHPRAVTLARPFLESENSELVAGAIAVLSGQTSETAAGFLRPLLETHPEHAAPLIEALYRAKDPKAVELIQAQLLTTEQPEVIEACLRYLGAHGGLASLPGLDRVLMSSTEPWAQSLPGRLRAEAVVAIREIGVRGNQRTSNDAERLLVKAWKEHPISLVNEWARWELGHFRSDAAFKYYEDAFERWSRAERRKNPRPWVDLASAQLQFKRWDDAIDSAKRAEIIDGKGEFKEDICVLLCRGYCGKETYASAERELKEYSADYSRLPKEYPEVAKMAAMEKYAYLFEPR